MVQTSHGTSGAVSGPALWFQRGASGLGQRLDALLLAEREQWPLWAPVALGAGIATWFCLPGPHLWLAAAAIAAGAALLCWRQEVAGRLLGWAGLLVAAGILLAWARGEAVRAPVFPLNGAAREVTGLVESRETLADGRDRLVVRVTAITRLKPDETPARVRLTSRKPLGETIERGARVRVKAWLQPPPGPAVPGGYDFGQRAWFEEIGGVGAIHCAVTVVSAPAPNTGVMDRIEAARDWLSERLRARIGGEAGGMAAALVTGDRSGIPEDVTQAMRDSGLAHLISISGLHIAMVTSIVFLLTRRLLALSAWLALRLPLKTFAALAAALAAIAYTLIAGSSVPTVRSCIATLIVLAGLLLGRQAISLRMVATGAGLILLFRPEALLSPSFQLSFAAVTGLVALYQSRFAERWLRRQEGDGRARRLLRWGAGLILSSLVAEAMLAPIAIHHFNQTGVYGVVANFIAIPLTSLVIMPGLMAAVLAESVGGIDWVTEVVRVGLDLVIALAREVSSWEGAVVRWHTPSNPAFGLMMFGLVWLCLWRTRLRLGGLLPMLAGVALAAMTPRPDLFVSQDGGMMAVRLEDGRMAFSTLRRGAFAREMWLEESGLDTTAMLPLADMAATPGLVQDCGEGVCRVALWQAGRWWSVVWLKDWFEAPALRRLCADNDIVIAPRRLPGWCAPKRLKLDAPARERLGATTLRFLDGGRLDVQGAETQRGRHPWAAAGR
ncbi:ComEC/Rec2 family competence protein [Pedomonas mirosovicensis]|uniref:ComEC/Rec2 family competence protein n=1 Tax=Pedomonas mirosovicensis TaxID=2908641 RepID=UPI00286F424E|nr:ComEC/Rec2 family competence protein [Pedomonas mirosovicensis]